MALAATIDADFSDFISETKAASVELAYMEDQAEKTGSALNKELGGSDKSLSQMTGTLKSIAGAFGIAFSVDAVIGFGKEILQTASDLTRLSQQTGLTVEQVQRLSYTAEQSGNSLDQITNAASKMQVALDTEKGQLAVEALGIEFRQFAAAKPYDQLLQVSDALRGIADPAEQAQRAVELFGESGAKLLPTLVSDMRAVGEAAVTSSDQQVAALAAAESAISSWSTAAKNAAVGTAGSLLLSGEQVAKQGLLKTIQMWVDSPTTSIFLQQLSAIGSAAKDTASKLTKAELAEIERQGGFGPGAGETPVERAKREKAEADAKREHEAAAKALAAAEKELGEVRKGYGGLLVSMTPETLKAVQADLQLGASQSAVATAYGLSVQQVKAASDELKTHITITTGLGAEWGNVGEKVTITANSVVADIDRMKDSAAAYEAETQRMADEFSKTQAKDYKKPLEDSTKATDELTDSTKQLSVALRDMGNTAMTAWESLAAGNALMDAYNKAGVATGMQIATGGYQFDRLKQSGVMPTYGQLTRNDTTTPWGNTLNVNVNSTDASDIAGKLVGEMKRNGIRL